MANLAYESQNNKQMLLDFFRQLCYVCVCVPPIFYLINNKTKYVVN